MVKEAYKFSLPPLIAGAGVLIVFRGSALGLWAGGILMLFGLFVLYFFRDPERTPPADADAVVSPADGRVTEIREEEWEGRAGKRISIFLSVWDVHVNRAPMAGRIRKVEYRPGRFYAAMRARASQENEQNVFSVETERGEMSFKQIAGWIARRVVSWKVAGDTVATGERIGLIRFGSRMDVWLPSEAEIVAKKGQFVAAGSSTLARWPRAGGKTAG
jgi:phosphatidylserine decarboxylase